MKDGMEYAEMLGMNVSSCDVVVKPAKRKKRRDVKEDVIAKVNEREYAEDLVKNTENLNEYEEITGMTVVAFIDKDVEKSKK